MTALGQIPVGMADIQVVKGEGSLVCFGLGSCIGLAAYCRRSKVGGMVHIMLPEAFKDRPVDKPGKFADTGIPALMAALKRAGAGDRLTWAYSGGAQVFQLGSASKNLDVGRRNIEAVEGILKKMGAHVAAKDVGGGSGRTMVYVVETGVITVKTVAKGQLELCNIKGVV